MHDNLNKPKKFMRASESPSFPSRHQKLQSNFSISRKIQQRHSTNKFPSINIKNLQDLSDPGSPNLIEDIKISNISEIENDGKFNYKKHLNGAVGKLLSRK
jgi:hypothetical protein